MALSSLYRTLCCRSYRMASIDHQLVHHFYNSTNRGLFNLSSISKNFASFGTLSSPTFEVFILIKFVIFVSSYFILLFFYILLLYFVVVFPNVVLQADVREMRFFRLVSQIFLGIHKTLNPKTMYQLKLQSYHCLMTLYNSFGKLSAIRECIGYLRGDLGTHAARSCRLNRGPAREIGLKGNAGNDGDDAGDVI